ncbi:Bromodomain-containing protein 7 [Varanus komodoensis]|uniref:bromodomain-containing protein 7 n=1 Tax=Varanus komodoensis TaxID=61221 RepID=UPI001CF7BAE1|nr:bromodomain-containing protein 7 [Varanus komodoensis]KAF7244683.1 Bromodomain-containing protein 7 [Varanus komodoensis]
MGKKHKKHKAEKYPYEEYVEKPLKLVLKVGGNEVAELSTQSTIHDSTLFEDKNEHEKHKDKKRKKRKKAEKQVPGEEKEKRRRKVKEDKKKRDRDRGDTEGERELKCQTPVRLEMPLEKPLASSLAKQEEVEQTPLQEALNQLVRQLQRKDPNAFFSFPVTDFIAPGYSMIIKRPMDFSTMKEKIKNNGYQSIEELKDNFKLMCTNAMVYNKPETIYYKAAKKLLHSGMKILSQERIQSLKQSIDFMADLQKSRKQKDKAGVQSSGEDDDGLGKDADCPDGDLKTFKIPSKEHKKKEKDLLEEKIRNSNLEREQELIERIIRESGGKLTKRPPNAQCEFERRKSDGTTTLGLLNPAEAAGEVGHGSAKLGVTAGRLQSGVNTLQGFKEDKRNKVTPVMYLNYGPFSSYAPAYDSTFANISKDDSDLIYSTYGEDSNQGNFSINEFLAKCQDYPYVMADSLLDVLTQGGHSRSLRELETVQSAEDAEGLRERAEVAKDIEVMETDLASRSSLTKERLTALRAVINFGMPTEEFESEEAEVFQRKLDETTKLLRELQDAQNERLSTKPPPNTICLLSPSYKEMHLAERVTSNLKELAQQVAPGDIVSTYGIRKAMGISVPLPDVAENCVDLTEEVEEAPQAPIAIGNECEPVAT